MSISKASLDITLATDRPALSIIMPVYQEAEIISSALQKLAPLRSRNIEIIVVDGGSNDATLTLATPYADQAIVAPSGRARQMNAGATIARGKTLLFLHADTELPKRADQNIQSALVAGFHWGRFDIKIKGSSHMLPIIGSAMNMRSRLTSIATGDQALFIESKLFEYVGGFPDQVLMEDIGLCRRLKHISKPACLRAKVITSGRRWCQNGVWRTIFLMWGLRLAYFLGVSPTRLIQWYRHVRS